MSSGANWSWLFWLLPVLGFYIIVLHMRVESWQRAANFVADANAYRSKIEAELNAQRVEARAQQARITKEKEDVERAQHYLNSVLDQTAREFPWAAKIYGDLIEAEADTLSRALSIKSRPALRAAESVRELKDAWRKRLERAKYGEYKATVHEHAFPFLVDFVEGAPNEDIRSIEDFEAQNGDDPVIRYLSPAEYSKLSVTQRNQLALQRYIERSKSNWETGRDYERFVGFQYESLGWEVDFHGAIKGLQDLGRDLIARKDGRTIIIQCKYWSQWRDVHENAIYQLFGSVVDFLFENDLVRGADDVFAALRRNQVSAQFVTSTTLTQRAEIACESLRIDLRAGVPFRAGYPRIKCNIGRTERIYHLPFDQQYDRVKISIARGERYASTVEEAELAGFRRAFRWRSSDESTT